MIYVYGDDGSDATKERVTAVAVVAGFEDWWQEVEADWLVRCGGIPFHANQCESDHGDYAGRPHEENKAMYRDLTGILASSPLAGIGIAIDLTAQRAIFPDSLELAYYRAFLEILQRVAQMAKNLGHVAKLTFDISIENEHNAKLTYSWMRDGDQLLADWLDPEISFAHAKDSPRLQVADLLAYEAWKALDHTVGPMMRNRKSWDLLRATQRFETYSYSSEWFTDLRKHIESGDLEKLVGFNQGDYRQWLDKTKRRHNMSNLITFLDWIGKRDT